MEQELSKKEKEILSETPEEAIRRILFWNDFKPEFRGVTRIKPELPPIKVLARD